MKIALTIFRYFPYGGLQKDCLRVAEECLARRHEVVVFTMEWSGRVPAELGVRVIEVSGFCNHSRARKFEQRVLSMIEKENFDCVLGFNRMAGLDFYFAGDNCLATSLPRHYPAWFLKINPRHRMWLKMEKSVFDPRASSATVFVISNQQKTEYRQSYSTPIDRFVSVPPDIDSRCGNVKNPGRARERTRRALGVAPDEFALILVGSDFRRKGAVRVITALAALSADLLDKTKFFLVGDDDSADSIAFARAIGVEDKVFALGARDDVPELLLAADCMVHPALDEAGGSVLVEALVSGLPVICTDVCGFSSYIAKLFSPEAVLKTPYVQHELNRKIEILLRKLPSISSKIVKDEVRRDIKIYNRSRIIVDTLEKACCAAESGEDKNG